MSEAKQFSAAESEADARIPYRHPQPKDSPPEIVVPFSIAEDERVWFPKHRMSGSAHSACRRRGGIGSIS